MDNLNQSQLNSAITLHNSATTALMFRAKPLSMALSTTFESSWLYSVVWVTQGFGTVRHGFSEYTFAAPCLLFFSPCQPFMFTESSRLDGIILDFAPEFYSVEQHPHEISCNGILFNNPYASPAVSLDDGWQTEFSGIIHRIVEECQQHQPDRSLLLAYLKILLIHAARLKRYHAAPLLDLPTSISDATLHQLMELIESHYRALKTPSDYAELLHLAPNTVNKLVKSTFKMTLTELIQARVMIEAKRELVLTDKQVREIAAELGYEDEYYFSRLFKKLAGIAPSQYRKYYLPSATEIVHF